MNKNIKISIIIVIALSIAAGVLALQSCKKESEIVNNFDNTIKLVNLYPDNQTEYPIKTTSVTMLSFASVEHYEATITSLKNQLEQYLDAFVEPYKNLSFDSLNLMMEQMNFNPDQPIINFLQHYGITSSMYLDYVNYENNWLSNSELVMEGCPQDAFPFAAVEMSLLNANGEVKIGNNILKLTSEGFVYIKSLDVVTLIRIDNGDMDALYEPTVTTNLLDKGKGTCTSWDHKNKPYEYASDKKVAMHVHFHSYPWKGSAEAEITSYHKKNGSWKKYSINMKVVLEAYFRDKDCSGRLNLLPPPKSKDTKSLSVSASSWGAFPQYRAEKGFSINGTFSFAGQQYFLTL